MRKFWFAAAISVPVMALSYPDLIPGLRDWMPMGSDTRRIVWALLGVLSFPVMVWAGSQFFTGMWNALKHRAANMHTLIAIGISAAYAYSVVSVAWPGIFPDMKLAEVFWDVTDIVVALVVLGLALEIKAKGRTSRPDKPCQSSFFPKSRANSRSDAPWACSADALSLNRRYRCQCTIIRIVKAKHRKAAF